MSDENLDAWTKAHNDVAYYAQRLASAFIEGDTAEVGRFATLYRAAVLEMERLDREYMGENK